MKGRWISNKEREDLVLSMRTPFKRKCELSSRSVISKKRENSKSTIISRVYLQIVEMNEKNLKWSTPEEWDESFKILGGSSSRRTSDAILKRMTWVEFLSLTSQFRD